MPISLESPNVENYFVGKGKIYFQPEGAAGVITDYDVGNCTEFELAPTIEKLDHFSSREGVKQKDKSIVLSKGATARIVMEEFTPDNLALMLLGTPNVADLSNVTIDMFADNAKRGHMRYVGTNEVGPRWTFDLPVVEFSPSGSISPISDEWGNLEVTGEVLVSGDPASFGTASSDFSAEAVPTNSVLPSIAGVAQVGQTLTRIVGTWTGNPTFTQQWQRDIGAGFVNIVGAIGATYVPVVGDIGFPIRVIVTGTNGAGNLAKTSGATADVIAA
jgi:hypothetical protein